VRVLVLESFFDFFKRFSFLAMYDPPRFDLPPGHCTTYRQITRQSPPAKMGSPNPHRFMQIRAVTDQRGYIGVNSLS
jgi:hypothetical protein